MPRSAPRPRFLRAPYLPSEAEVAAATTPRAKARLMRITVQSRWRGSDLQSAVANNGRNEEFQDFNRSCEALRDGIRRIKYFGKDSSTGRDRIAEFHELLNSTRRLRHHHEQRLERVHLIAAE